MAIALLGNELATVARLGYPSDGSKRLPRRLERLCTLLAAGDCTYTQAGEKLHVSMTTVYRNAHHPVLRARIAFLKEQLATEAYSAEPLVDKRNRVVMAAALARTIHEQGQRQEWQETLAVTKAGTPITGFDWRRTDQLRQLLDYLAKEVGDRSGSTQPSTTTVGVSLSVDDAVLRVQALFSRVAAPDGDASASAQGVAPLAEGVPGGARGVDAGTTTARSRTEYKNESHAGALEAEYDDATPREDGEG